MRSNIRQLRKERHISQSQLGDAIGLSQQVVSRIERDRDKIQIDVLIHLADYFHVSTDCILGYRRKDDGESSLEKVMMMANTADADVTAEIDKLEQMDERQRMLVWHYLVGLKQLL